MLKYILLGFCGILFFSQCQNQVSCETKILKDAIWLSFINDSSFVTKVPIDSVKFRFVEPSVGKDSIQKVIFKEKANIQNKKYFFTFNKIIVSKNTKIFISFINQHYVISDIELVSYERKYFLWSSDWECSIKNYKVNGVLYDSYPFIINVASY